MYHNHISVVSIWRVRKVGYSPQPRAAHLKEKIMLYIDRVEVHDVPYWGIVRTGKELTALYHNEWEATNALRLIKWWEKPPTVTIEEALEALEIRDQIALADGAWALKLGKQFTQLTFQRPSRPVFEEAAELVLYGWLTTQEAGSGGPYTRLINRTILIPGPMASGGFIFAVGENGPHANMTTTIRVVWRRDEPGSSWFVMPYYMADMTEEDSWVVDALRRQDHEALRIAARRLDLVVGSDPQ